LIDHDNYAFWKMKKNVLVMILNDERFLLEHKERMKNEDDDDYDGNK